MGHGDLPDLKMEATFGTHYTAKRHCVSLVLYDVVDPFPPLWGLLLGDMVHNYRCCLDHVAWALYKRGKSPNLTERQEQNVGFPICAKRSTFNNTIKQKLPGVKRADTAIVRRFQPFAPGESRAFRHVFTILRELSNADKHRSIQPVVAVPNRIKFDPLRPIDCIIRRIAIAPGYIGSLRPGTELARFYVKKTGPRPDIELLPRFNFVPAIHERLTVADFVTKTMRLTAMVLREFSDPTEGVRSLVGESLLSQGELS